MSIYEIAMWMLLFAVASGEIARSRGRSWALWFFAGLLGGPLGLIVWTLKKRH